jgi:hypothetical protein
MARLSKFVGATGEIRARYHNAHSDDGKHRHGFIEEN